MTSVVVPLVSLMWFPKGLYSSVYSVVFLVLCLWASLRSFDITSESQVLMENYISHSFLLLSLWLGLLVFLVEYGGFMKNQFYNLVFFVCSLCGLAFMSGSGMMFFMLFELVFVPITALVLIWGYNKERISAGIYMITYSSLGGSFHLVSLLSMEESLGTIFLSGNCVGVGESIELFLWWVGIMGLFLVKAPLFLLHLWLPKAHVEAPTCASMLLAGLLLKLGVFGMFLYESFWQGSCLWVSIWQVLGLWGGFYASFLCLREQNVKKVVALSSVGHMSLSVASFFIGLEGPWTSMLLMGVMHGLCSSGLFSWTGIHYYQGSSQSSFLSSGYRSVGGAKGPILMLLLVGVAGLPPMASFWGEYYIYASIFSSVSYSGVFLVVTGILNLLFLCYLGLWVCHANWGPSSAKVSQGGDRGVVCMMGHCLPCIFLFFSMFMIYI